MKINKVNAEISKEDEDQTIQNLNDIEALIGFLVNLSVKERIRIAKMSRKSMDFVERSLQYAQDNPLYMPAYVELEEFKKDVETAKSIRRILGTSGNLTRKLKGGHIYE